MLSLRGLEIVGPAGVLEELEEEEDPELEEDNVLESFFSSLEAFAVSDCFLKLGDPNLEYLLSFLFDLLALLHSDSNPSS